MTFKKMIASALSASLVLGAAGISEIQPDIRIPSFSASAADIVDSGKCGDNATWTLDSEGTLTISGTGEMSERAFYEREDIKKVIIENDVTSIGDWAFEDSPNLESISIPDSVTSIGHHAFFECKKIKSIIIPDSVTSIEYNTFEWCESLETITIPDSVTDIACSAFHATPWLEAKRKENPLVVINGILFDGKTCSGDVVIPNTVTSIGEAAFAECGSIKSVTIPDSVTSIGVHAFSICESLESINIPDSVISIRQGAFSSCKKLKSITIFNPECEILRMLEEPDGVIYDDYTGTIKGYNGSTAEAYAKKYGYTFESLVDAPTAVTTSAITKATTTTSTTTTTTITTTAETTASTTEADVIVVDTPTIIDGDANCDGKVTVADAVAILQFIGNRDKYPLSDNGKIAADVDGVAGITGKDALVIQQVDAGLYKPEDLPLLV